MSYPSKKAEKMPLNEGGSLYRLPYECEIYSLPHDSIVGSENETKMPEKVKILPKIEDKSKRHSIHSFGAPYLNLDHKSRPSCSSSAGICNNKKDVVFGGGGGGGGGGGEERNNNLGKGHDGTNVKTYQDVDNFSLVKNKVQVSPPLSSRLSLNSSQVIEVNLGNGIIVRDEIHPNSSSLGKEKKKIGLNFLSNIFRKSRLQTSSKDKLRDDECRGYFTHDEDEVVEEELFAKEIPKSPRALPLLPPDSTSEKYEKSTPENESDLFDEEGFSQNAILKPCDVAASLERVKDCGWYWGNLSSEGAEDLLLGEPDGSFIVRDSSDARYIFSLTFKLNGLIRHVRIEHDQGNFSFGPLTRFKASTIVDFVEKAVAHSRSGRYLFFLHRRPSLGPMRVQLLHPFSRYRQLRSLQHMCRFVILKTVRKDLVGTLSLPKLLLDYLNAPQYYYES